MLMDRLIRRESPDNITRGTILSVDTIYRRASVLGETGLELWVGYNPDEYPDLCEDQSVIIGRLGATYVLLRLSSDTAPETTTLMEV